MTPLVTFKGWEGKWWKNIKPGRAAASALLTVLPGSGTVATLAKGAGQRVGSKLIRGASRRIGRWFRRGKDSVPPGLRTARGGSAITRGKLDLGGGKAFRAGGTAFNIRRAGVAAVGVGGAVGVGKLVQPRAAVTAASSGQVAPRLSSAPGPSSSPAPRGSAGPGTGTGTRRCCPPGQRMLCFKRKHNPEAEAKRRARRKAAREKTKERVARARSGRRTARRSGAPSAKQLAARKRFAAASRRGRIRKGARL